MKQEYILKTYFSNSQATYQVGGQGEYRTLNQALDKAGSFMWSGSNTPERVEVIRISYNKQSSKVSCVVEPNRGFSRRSMLYFIRDAKTNKILNA
jgi:hypothetical protein